MSPLKQLRKLITAPPHKTAAKVFTRAKQAVENAVRRRFDLRTNTYSAHIAPSDENQTFSPLLKGFYVEKLLESVDQTEIDSLSALCGRYLNHEFDLLGSGWVQVRHGMTCKGLNGIRYDHGSQVNCDKNGDWLQNRVYPANRKRSQAIWKLVDTDYIPIDWQRDFKSGYRWNETTWFRDIPLGHLPGVDIKVPWELARMQHLPQLALAFNLLDSSPGNEPLRHQLCSGFRNQILDFLATNPPRFGVNWQCAMDVAIRVAN